MLIKIIYNKIFINNVFHYFKIKYRYFFNLSMSLKNYSELIEKIIIVPQNFLNCMGTKKKKEINILKIISFNEKKLQPYCTGFKYK